MIHWLIIVPICNMIDGLARIRLGLPVIVPAHLAVPVIVSKINGRIAITTTGLNVAFNRAFDAGLRFSDLPGHTVHCQSRWR